MEADNFDFQPENHVPYDRSLNSLFFHADEMFGAG